MNWKQAVRATAFIIIFVLLFNTVSRILTISSDDHDYQAMANFYEEKENSADAVCIGSSNTYAFWNPLIAWEEFGITVPAYTCSSQPFIISEYLLDEARKSQPDALYIFNINTIETKGLGGTSDDDVVMHRVLDSMPLSINKLKLTDYMCDVVGLPTADRLEYYFPIIKYHSRWNELDESFYSPELNGFKGADYYNHYFTKAVDVNKKYISTDKKCELNDILSDSLNSLLDYCDKNKVKALFITSPRCEKTDNYERINKVNEIIESRGYPTLNLLDKYDDCNLDLSQDYYNDKHTNIHGSIKYTYYISQYLIENYGFKDKRNNSEYFDWDTGFENYSKLMSRHVIDFELDSVHRNYELDVPENINVIKNSSDIYVSWDKVNGADGYTIFRTKNNSGWKEVGETENSSFVDISVKKKCTYRYAVVPYSIKDGERYYGNYLYNGEKIET